MQNAPFEVSIIGVDQHVWFSEVGTCYETIKLTKTRNNSINCEQIAGELDTIG